MDDHHVCRCPLGHQLLIAGIVVGWTLLGALWGIPRAAKALTHSSTWFWLSMGLSLTPGIALVKDVTRWRCQPVQRPGLRPVDYAVLGLWLLSKEK